MMKWLVTPCLALLMAILVLPAAADAASATVTLKLKGSGSFRINNNVTNLGLTCGPNGSSGPDLKAKTGVEVTACAYSTPLSCPGGAPDCVVTATVIARKPQAPAIAPTDVQTNWKFSGWSTASTVSECPPADGTQEECTFPIGSCTSGVCTGRPNMLLIADFRDVRPPGIVFGCRQASCPNQLPAVNASVDGRAPFQARSDEYRSQEYTTIECAVDGAGFTPCEDAPAPYTDGTFLTPQVSEGTHALRIRAVDASGNVTATPVERDWTQRYPPRAQLNGGFLGGATNKTSPQFSFGNATGSPAAYRCWMDADAPADCNAGTFTPASPLAPGFHTFYVAARRTDVGGVEQAVPTAVPFTVDVTAPIGKIDSGPTDGLQTSDNTATFSFSALDASGFTCKLDEEPAVSCSDGSITYTGLAPRSHTFVLRAQDNANNFQDPGVTRTWTVLADDDRDRFPSTVDCDDHNAAIHPNAVDIPGTG